MPLYLAIHSPIDPDDESLHRPTDLHGLAMEAGDANASPRWLKAWSPDLHEERIITMWEAENAEEILKTMQAFGFLDHMETKAFQVIEWGPDDVLSTELTPS
jgi:hypothetical protein